MHDFIEPMIAIPLAAVLCAAWWLVERCAGPRATKHEIRRHDAR